MASLKDVRRSRRSSNSASPVEPRGRSRIKRLLAGRRPRGRGGRSRRRRWPRCSLRSTSRSSAASPRQAATPAVVREPGATRCRKGGSSKAGAESVSAALRREESGEARQRALGAPGRTRGETAERLTKSELLEQAKEVGTTGRSETSKDDLAEAVESQEQQTKEELLEQAQAAEYPSALRDVEGRACEGSQAAGAADEGEAPGQAQAAGILGRPRCRGTATRGAPQGASVTREELLRRERGGYSGALRDDEGGAARGPPVGAALELAPVRRCAVRGPGSLDGRRVGVHPRDDPPGLPLDGVRVVARG